MILKWYRAGNDYTARHRDNIFRLHKTQIERNIKINSFKEKVEIEVYDLQIKKVDHIQFKSLDQYFGIECYGRTESELVKRISVEAKGWEDINEIIEETENILAGYELIPVEKEPSILSRDEKLLETASEVISLTLQKMGFFEKSYIETLKSCLPKVISAALVCYIEQDIERYIEADEEASELYLRSLRIDIARKMMVQNPETLLAIIDNGSIKSEAENEIIDEVAVATEQPLPCSLERNGENEKGSTEGYVFLIYNPVTELYAFRKSTSDVNPDAYIISRLKQQRTYPMECVGYFKANDVHKMFRFIKKYYNGKLKNLTHDEWPDFWGTDWYRCDQGDVESFKREAETSFYHKKLAESQRKKHSIVLGGCVAVLKDEFGFYHLRTTKKNGIKSIIRRGNVDRLEPVVGFLTEDVNRFKEYFKNVFAFHRLPEGNGNRERYKFGKEEMVRIANLENVDSLQVLETIVDFKNVD